MAGTFRSLIRKLSMVVSVFDARFSNRFTILLKISRNSVTYVKKTRVIKKSRQLLFCSNNRFVYSIILKNYELRIAYYELRITNYELKNVSLCLMNSV